jgi:hypothetical protein
MRTHLLLIVARRQNRRALASSLRLAMCAAVTAFSLVGAACGGVVNSVGNPNDVPDAGIDARTDGSSADALSATDASGESSRGTTREAGDIGDADGGSPVCAIGRYVPAGDVTCTTDADCTLLACPGCGWVVPLLGVNTTSTFRCPSLPCPPPPPGGGGCTEKGFEGEDCMVVSERDEVAVECSMGQCHSYATKP